MVSNFGIFVRIVISSLKQELDYSGFVSRLELESSLEGSLSTVVMVFTALIRSTPRRLVVGKLSLGGSTLVLRLNVDMSVNSCATDEPSLDDWLSLDEGAVVELAGLSPATPFQFSMLDKTSRLIRRRRFGSLRRYCNKRSDVITVEQNLELKKAKKMFTYDFSMLYDLCKNNSHPLLMIKQYINFNHFEDNVVQILSISRLLTFFTFRSSNIFLVYNIRQMYAIREKDVT